MEWQSLEQRYVLFCCNTQRSNHLLAHCPLLGQCSSPMRESAKKGASNLSTRTKSSLSLFISTPICLQVYAIHSHIRLELATGTHHWLGYKSSVQVKAILGKCFTIWDFNLSEIWRTWGFEAPAQWRRLPRERWDHGSPSKKHPPEETAWSMARKCRWLDRKGILVQKHLVCKSQRNWNWIFRVLGDLSKHQKDCILILALGLAWLLFNISNAAYL